MKTPVSIGALQLRRILETSLYADDLDQAEAFYKSVLGLNLFAKEAGRHLFFKLGDQMLLIFNPAKTIEESEVASHGASGPGHIADRTLPWNRFQPYICFRRLYHFSPIFTGTPAAQV